MHIDAVVELVPHVSISGRTCTGLILKEARLTGVALARWHEIARTGNTSGLRELLAPDVVFESPVVHTPQRGVEVVLRYLESAVAVLGGPDFRYVGEWSNEEGVVLEFAARVDGIDVNGVDMIAFDRARQHITRFKVMLRPLKAINMVHQSMGRRLADAAPAGAPGAS